MGTVTGEVVSEVGGGLNFKRPLFLNEMPPSVRSWGCPDCGMTHDRDVNAAKNLAALAALPRASREVTIVDKRASTPRKSRVASRLDEAISATVSACGHKV